MLLKSTFAFSFGIILCGGFAAAQDTQVTQPARINRPTELRQHVDKGAAGSRTKKTAQAFSGQINKPFGKQDAGLTGSKVRPKLNTLPDNGQLPERTVTMKAVRKTVFENVDPKNTMRTVADAQAKTTSDPRAYLISPPNGSTVAPTQTFTWTSGTGVNFYELWIGSCYDCTDILDESEGTNRSRTVSLPTDGRVIYLTLFSFIGNYYYWVDYSFTASTPVVPGSITSPAEGATLNNPQTFNWNAGNNILDFQLTIGSCFECGDLLYEDEGTNTSRTVNLPTDGRTLFVTLYSYGNDGNWYWIDYQFRAFVQTQVTTYRVNFTNDYLYPINIYVNGNLIGSVNPSATQYADLSVAPLAATFELVQPTLNGNSLGDTVSGSWTTVTQPSGTYNYEAVTRMGSTWYFLPQISNNTSMPLAIEVNGGLQAENRCNCVAPAYTDNVRAGYYELFNNSNVRLFYENTDYTGSYLYFGTDANGNVSPGGPLYQLVQPTTDLISLVANSLP